METELQIPPQIPHAHALGEIVLAIPERYREDYIKQLAQTALQPAKAA
jgi:hypothetical protein